MNDLDLLQSLLPVFQDVAGTAMWTIIKHHGSKALRREKDFGIEIGLQKSRTLKILSESLGALSLDAQVTTGEVELIRRVLTNSDAKALAAELMALSALGLLTSVEQDINNSFYEIASNLAPSGHGNDCQKVANLICDVLERYTVKELVLDSKGRRRTEEAVERLQYHAASSLIVNNLETIKRHCSALSHIDRPTRLSRDDFLTQYRTRALQRASTISLASLTSEHNYPLHLLYITTELEFTNTLSLNASDILDLNKAVILGVPGGGKSTLLKFASALMLANPTRNTPFVIVLRDYVKRAVHGETFVNYLVKSFASSYQLNVSEPAVETLLLDGRSTIMFDGIDEVLDIARRREVRDAIDSFVDSYPMTAVYVTCRENTYLQSPLQHSSFSIIRLPEFSDTQVRLYASACLDLLSTNETAFERAERLDGFLTETRDASDLRRNPLMLSLMCTLYRRRNHIPDNRLEFYEECNKLLLTEWDKHRGIVDETIAEVDIKSAIMSVAAETISSGDGDTQILASSLKQSVISYLDRQFENLTVAERSANAFVEFCQGRAWVFVPIRDGYGRPAFEFVHRTFLEFYAASHLARKCDAAEELANEVSTYIRRSSWDVVCQLCLHYAIRNYTNGGERFIRRLLSIYESLNDRAEKLAALDFISRAATLAFIPTSILRQIVSECFSSYRDTPISISPAMGDDSGLDLLAAPMLNCLSVRAPGLDAVADQFESLAMALLDEHQSYNRVRRLLTLAAYAYTNKGWKWDLARANYWMGWSKKFVGHLVDTSDTWREDRALALAAFEFGFVSLTDACASIYDLRMKPLSLLGMPVAISNSEVRVQSNLARLHIWLHGGFPGAPFSSDLADRVCVAIESLAGPERFKLADDPETLEFDWKSTSISESNDPSHDRRRYAGTLVLICVFYEYELHKERASGKALSYNSPRINAGAVGIYFDAFRLMERRKQYMKSGRRGSNIDAKTMSDLDLGSALNFRLRRLLGEWSVGIVSLTSE